MPIGYTAANPVNYNNSNGGPPGVNGVGQMNHMQMNAVSVPPQQLPINTGNGQMNGGSYTHSMPPPQQSDFGEPISCHLPHMCGLCCLWVHASWTSSSRCGRKLALLYSYLLQAWVNVDVTEICFQGWVPLTLYQANLIIFESCTFDMVNCSRSINA